MPPTCGVIVHELQYFKTSKFRCSLYRSSLGLIEVRWYRNDGFIYSLLYNNTTGILITNILNHVRLLALANVNTQLKISVEIYQQSSPQFLSHALRP